MNSLSWYNMVRMDEQPALANTVGSNDVTCLTCYLTMKEQVMLEITLRIE